MKGAEEGLRGAVTGAEGFGGVHGSATKPSELSPVPPSTPDWNSWATFSNEVSRALQAAGVDALFSKRNRVARHLWDLGYRPTEDQIAAEVAGQHNREDA